MSRFLQYIFLGGVGILFLFTDIWTKDWAQTILISPQEVLPDSLLTFSLHTNTGIAFSLPVPFVLQITLSVLLLGVLFWVWQSQHRNIGIHLCFVSIFAGAIGNMRDRLMLGSVTDFISIGSFPVFNIADILIFIGVSGLLLHEVFFHKRHAPSPLLK